MKLICYLSNGYPSIEASRVTAQRYIEAGCDIIEIDFPSRDPYLEGEYIVGRMKDALAACGDYREYMKGIRTIVTDNPGTKFILLSYENTAAEIGPDAFTAFCRKAGIYDMIYVGSNDGGLKKTISDSGVKISCYVQFHMPEDEIRGAVESDGFVYMQAKPVTGNINPAYPTLKSCIKALKQRGIDREIYCGVGIYTPKDVEMAAEAEADGVFVGSAVLKLQNEPEKLRQAIADFKRACGR